MIIGSSLGRGLGVFAKDVGTEADLRQGVELLLERGVEVNAANDAASPRFTWRHRRDSTRS